MIRPWFRHAAVPWKTTVTQTRASGENRVSTKPGVLQTVFASVFGSGPARHAYERARDRKLELVFRSASPGPLRLPWELMRDPAGPVALNLAGVSRALPTAELARTAAIAGERLRVLMVISRPAGTGDIGYQMIARPLLERLDAVRGQVDLVVLRPPTLEALREILAEAASAGEPFQVVHFDGHGVLPGHKAGEAHLGGRPVMMTGPAGEGVLAFEKPGGGSDKVPVSKVAVVLKEARVPVVVLNACQSGAVGKDLEAAIATRLLREGCAAVVAMAYSVYAVAAAEFMAVFYEHLFAGDSLSVAVTAGRRRLYEKDGRPSPKGELPLADWLVPVHYLRRDVAFPQARTSRPQGKPSLEALLDQLRAHGGVGEGSARDNLDPVGVFVGRDDLFLQLEVAARLQRVVVLHGQGGIGKTELVKAFGRWWRDTGGVDDPEWVLWHSFEPGVASFGLDGVITETGLAVFGADFARLDQEERLRVVEELLTQRRLLLIWDNFETVHAMPDPTGATTPLDETERAKMKMFLARLGASGRSAVIITSRATEDWLGPIRRIVVGGLAPEEAAQYAHALLAPYLAAVVAQRRARRAFGELLDWLDGHPLSMRLILPCLDTDDPETLLAGLHGTAALPGGTEDGERSTSLAASITYSFTHLSAQTRRLLPTACLFHGVVDAQILAAFSRTPDVPGRFAGASGQEWAQALADAARVGLLTPLFSGLYRVHPALPAYLATQWRIEEADSYDSMRDAATRALATAYAGLGSWLYEQITSGQADVAFTVIDLQRHTLGSLLTYTLDDKEMWEQAQDIAQPLDEFWDTYGLNDEAAAWTEQIQAATEDPEGNPPRLDTPAGHLWLFITSAQAVRQVRAMCLDEAERTYRQLLDMLQAQPASPEQKFRITEFTHNLAVIAMQRGRLEEAEDLLRMSLAIFEDLGDQPHMAGTSFQLAVVTRQRGRLEEAEDLLRGSLAIYVDLGDQPHMAASYHQFGIIAQERGRLEEAEDWYRKSLAIYEDLGDRPGMASSYQQLGTIAQERERLEEAEDWYTGSRAIKEELGDRSGQAGTYHQLGMVAQKRGRLEEAEDWYRKSLAIFEDLGDQPHMAASYHQFGVVAQKRGRLEEAEDWYRKSLAIFEDLGDQPHMAACYQQLGVVAYWWGRLEEAEDWFCKSLAIFEEFGDRARVASIYGQLGLLAEDRGQTRQALEWTVRCVNEFAQFPHPMTDPAPDVLAGLTAQLGFAALEATWLRITGSPLPAAVRDYVKAHHPTTGEQEPG